MLGHGCPTCFRSCAAGKARLARSFPRAWPSGPCWRLTPPHFIRVLAIAFLAFVVNSPARGGLVDRPAQLRIVWGAGAASRQAWRGSIEVEGGEVTSFAPLGVEADEAAALQLVAGKLIVNPLRPRSFDGCDVTIAGSAGCTLVVKLSDADSAAEEPLRIELSDVLANSFRGSIANGSGYLLAMRAPAIDFAWQSTENISYSIPTRNGRLS